MNREEYINYYCKQCCKQCDGSSYHQYHCTDEDIIEETWEQCQTYMIERAQKWLENWCNDMSVLDGHDIEEFINHMKE